MHSDLARLSTIFSVLLAIQNVTAGQLDGVYEDMTSSLPWMQQIRKCVCMLLHVVADLTCSGLV